MVKYNTGKLNAVFSALSDETRRGIIVSLTKKSLSAQELAKPYDISLPAISRHLKVLENAGILKRDIQGRQHIFSLHPDSLASASDWLEHHQRFWQQSLQNLDNYLKKRRKK